MNVLMSGFINNDGIINNSVEDIVYDCDQISTPYIQILLHSTSTSLTMSKKKYATLMNSTPSTFMAH